MYTLLLAIVTTGAALSDDMDRNHIDDPPGQSPDAARLRTYGRDARTRVSRDVRPELVLLSETPCLGNNWTAPRVTDYSPCHKTSNQQVDKLAAFNVKCNATRGEALVGFRLAPDSCARSSRQRYRFGCTSVGSLDASPGQLTNKTQVVGESIAILDQHNVDCRYQGTPDAEEGSHSVSGGAGTGGAIAAFSLRAAEQPGTTGRYAYTCITLNSPCSFVTEEHATDCHLVEGQSIAALTPFEVECPHGTTLSSFGLTASGCEDNSRTEGNVFMRYAFTCTAPACCLAAKDFKRAALSSSTTTSTSVQQTTKPTASAVATPSTTTHTSQPASTSRCGIEDPPECKAVQQWCGIVTAIFYNCPLTCNNPLCKTTPTVTETTTPTATETTTATTTNTFSASTTASSTRTSSETTTGSTTESTTATSTQVVGMLACHAQTAAVSVLVAGGSTCSEQVGVLSKIASACGAEVDAVECSSSALSSGTPLFAGVACAAVVEGLNRLVNEYISVGHGDTNSAVAVCNLAGYIKVRGTCSAFAETLNDALRDVQNGVLNRNCEITTQTTSETTSETTSASTTVTSTTTSTTTTSTTTTTTTAYKQGVACAEVAGSHLLVADSGSTCARVAVDLGALASECGHGNVAIDCKDTAAGPVLVNAEACSGTVDALNALLDGHSTGQHVGKLTCELGGYIKDDADCGSSSAVLTDALAAYHNGLFSNCVRTTATTTASSTGTTTESATKSSTATTSGSTTASITASSSVSSTASSTATTSASTTATASATSSATTSASSTAKSSATTSFTSTVSSTASTTQSSTATSTAASTVTTTATVSATSTASSSGTASVTSTASSTLRTSATTSATSTPSFSVSSTVTTSASSTATSTVSSTASRTQTTSASTTASASATSTVSTTFTTSGTTTLTSTASSTISTSVSSSATASQTSSATTSQTSSATTSATSTPLSTVSSTASTSVTHTETSTATSTATITAVTSVTSTASATATSPVTSTMSSTVTTEAFGGNVDCVDFSGSAYLSVPSDNCAGQVNRLNGVIARCGVDPSLQLQCANPDKRNPEVLTQLVASTDHCSTIAAALSRALLEYGDVREVGVVVCNLGGYLKMSNSKTCGAAATVLNSAINDLASGVFGNDCVVTTATTTGSSTATTTDTTTITSTEYSVGVGCVQNTGVDFMSVVGLSACARVAVDLSAMASECGFGKVALECKKTSAAFVLVAPKTCHKTASALNTLLDGFSTGQTFGELSCEFGGFIKDDVNCVSSMAVLTDALVAHYGGTFSGCARTTATTTASSTATASATTTMSSTASSTASSSASTSESSTAASTASSTGSSTEFSTLTTTAGTTATTSAATTATSSASSTATTSAATSASSTVSTTATTSPSTSQASTATETAFSSASTTQTTSLTSTETSSASSTVASTASSTESTTATSSASSTALRTAPTSTSTTATTMTTKPICNGLPDKRACIARTHLCGTLRSMLLTCPVTCGACVQTTSTTTSVTISTTTTSVTNTSTTSTTTATGTTTTATRTTVTETTATTTTPACNGVPDDDACKSLPLADCTVPDDVLAGYSQEVREMCTVMCGVCVSSTVSTTTKSSTSTLTSTTATATSTTLSSTTLSSTTISSTTTTLSSSTTTRTSTTGTTTTISRTSTTESSTTSTNTRTTTSITTKTMTTKTFTTTTTVTTATTTTGTSTTGTTTSKTSTTATSTTVSITTTTQLCNGLPDGRACSARVHLCGTLKSMPRLCPVTCGACVDTTSTTTSVTVSTTTTSFTATTETTVTGTTTTTTTTTSASTTTTTPACNGVPDDETCKSLAVADCTIPEDVLAGYALEVQDMCKVMCGVCISTTSTTVSTTTTATATSSTLTSTTGTSTSTTASSTTQTSTSATSTTVSSTTTTISSTTISSTTTSATVTSTTANQTTTATNATNTAPTKSAATPWTKTSRTAVTVGVIRKVAGKLSELLHHNRQSIQAYADSLAAEFVAKLGLPAAVQYTAALFWRASQRRSEDGYWELEILFADPEVDSATICAAATLDGTATRCEEVQAASAASASTTLSRVDTTLTTSTTTNGFEVNFVIVETCDNGSAEQSVTRTAVFNAISNLVGEVLVPSVSSMNGKIVDLRIECLGENFLKVSVYFSEMQLAAALRRAIPVSLPVDGRALEARPMSVWADTPKNVGEPSVPSPATTTTSPPASTSSSSSSLSPTRSSNFVFINVSTSTPIKPVRSTGSIMVLAGAVVLPLSLVVVCVILFIRKNRAAGIGHLKQHWKSPRVSITEGYGMMSNFVINSGAGAGAGAGARASGLTEKALSWDNDMSSIMQPLSHEPTRRISRQNPLFQPHHSDGGISVASAGSGGALVASGGSKQMQQQRAFVADYVSSQNQNPMFQPHYADPGYDTSAGCIASTQQPDGGNPPRIYDSAVGPISPLPMRRRPAAKRASILPDLAYACPGDCVASTPAPPLMVPPMVPQPSRIPGVGGLVSRLVL